MDGFAWHSDRKLRFMFHVISTSCLFTDLKLFSLFMKVRAWNCWYVGWQPDPKIIRLLLGRHHLQRPQQPPNMQCSVPVQCRMVLYFICDLSQSPVWNREFMHPFLNHHIIWLCSLSVNLYYLVVALESTSLRHLHGMVVQFVSGLSYGYVWEWVAALAKLNPPRPGIFSPMFLPPEHSGVQKAHGFGCKTTHYGLYILRTKLDKCDMYLWNFKVKKYGWTRMLYAILFLYDKLLSLEYPLHS
jgi:hypothetical protein